MAKIIIVIASTSVNNGEAMISYTASVIQTATPYSYSADYQVNTGITLNNNLLSWRNKIIAQALEKGIIVTAADLIIFGGPV